MSSQVLPSLRGLGINVTRTPIWDTVVQENVSGKEVRIANQAYPRWRWNLEYNVLRSAGGYTELQQLVGFFNTLKGRFDSFLYTDADDYSVTDQAIGVGNGSTSQYQLVRAFGSFVEPIYAPNNVSSVMFNGVTQAANSYTISTWGNTTPGILTFTSAPSNGVVITANMTYYFPCRLENDEQDFEMFLSRYYKTSGFSFISVKN